MKQTKQKILKVAFDLMVKKGYDGVSFQDIAEKAGVTKAMLNYYFKNKENLLNLIFTEALERYLLPNFQILQSSMSLEDKIYRFTDKVIDTFINHPRIPLFIADATNRHHKILRKTLTKFTREHLKHILDGFRQSLREELGLAEEKIPQPTVLMTDMLSLTLFPFIVRPGIIELCMEGSSQQFKEFMRSKKQHISQLIMLYIRSIGK